MRQVISMVLSLLILLSSSGLTYAKHFCGEIELFSKVTLGHEHLSCGMKMATPVCEDSMERPGCCDNEYVQVEVDDTFAKANMEQVPPVQWAAVLVSVFVLLQQPVVTQEFDGLIYYHPPPPDDDLLVRYDRFLI